MTDSEYNKLKLREEEKRYGAMPPLTWAQIADMLTWAENQLPPDEHRNRPRTHPASGGR